MIRDSFIKSGRETKSPFITNPFRFAGVEWATALTNWLKRKPLTINGAAKTPTFQDDFNTNDWSGGTGLITVDNVTDERIEFEIENGGDDSLYYDLTSVNDERFVFTGKLTLDTVQNPNSGTTYGFIGLSSTIDDCEGSQDAIGLRLIRNATGSTNQYHLVSTDGVSITSATSTQLLNISPETGTIYFKLIRESSTLAKIIIYSDVAMTEVLDSVRLTIAGTTQTLRYLKVTNRDAASQTTGAFLGSLDDFKFYDNETVTINIPGQQTPTYSDDFDSDNWTDNDGQGVTGGVVDFTQNDDGSNDSTVYDLTTAASDDGHTLRFSLENVTLTNPSANECDIFIGFFSANQATAANSSQDWYGLMLRGTTGGYTYYLRDVDGAAPTGTGNDYTFTYAPAVETVYVELKRTSTTTYECSLFSDSTYTTLLERGTGTCASGTTGLQYIGIKNSVQSTTGVIRSKIDTMRFYDNITEVNPATLTDYPLPIKIIGDADLQEKTTETLEDKFDGTDDWTDSDATNIGVNTTTDRLEFIAKRDGTNDSSVYDLTSVSDSAWVLRGEMVVTDWTTASSPQYIFFGISDADSTANHSTSQDAIGLWFRAYNASGSTIRNVWANGQSLDNTNESLFTMDLSARRIFIEVKRTSTTTMEVGLYADASYTIPLEVHNNITLPDTVASLRYLTVKNFNLSGGTSTFNGYFENVRFWDGITNPVDQETATEDEQFGAVGSWVEQHAANIGISAGVLNFDSKRDNTNDATSLPLSTTLDKKFVTRTTLDLTTVTAGADATPMRMYIGLSNSASTVDSATAQNFLGFGFDISSTVNRFFSSVVENAVLNTGDDLGWARSLTAETLYLEIIRNEQTLTVNLYSDSSFSILLETEDTPITGEVGDLDNFWIGNEKATTAGADSTLIGTIDNLQLWNGITSPNAEGRKIVFTDNSFDGDAVEYASETVSYDPINGDLEAVVKIPTLTTGADTTIQMYYDYAATNPSYVPEVIPTISSILEQDFSADESWTHSSKTSISSGVLNWQNNATGTNLFHHAYRAIPQLKNDYFDVRFKLDIDVLSGSGNQDVASISWILCDANNTNSTSVGGTATGIGFRLGFGSASYVPVFEAFEVEGTGFNSDNAVDNIDFATTPTTGIIYIRLHRTSLTSVTIGIYSDPDFALTNLIEEETLTITSNINDLDIFQISTRNGSQETTRSVSGTIDDFTIINNNREEATYDGNYKAVHNLHGNSLDSTANGNDGTDTAIAYEQQNNSVGAGFDGATSIIIAGTGSSMDNIFDGGGTYSTTFNVKSDGEGSVSRLLDKGALSIKTVTESGGFVALEFKQAWSGNNGTWTTAVNIAINELHTLDVMYNAYSVTNDPIFVIDGIRLTVGNGITETVTPTGTRTSDAGVVYNIGNEAGISNTVDGFINNAKMSSVVRPSSEAITSYNAEKSDSDIITAGDENTQ